MTPAVRAAMKPPAKKASSATTPLAMPPAMPAVSPSAPLSTACAPIAMAATVRTTKVAMAVISPAQIGPQRTRSRVPLPSQAPSAVFTFDAATYRVSRVRTSSP